MSIAERSLIQVWIEQGAPQRLCAEPVTDTLPFGWQSPVVCFERDILPVMRSSCGVTDCHDPYTVAGGYNFTDYSGILKGTVPGNPESSKIFQVISVDGSSGIIHPSTFPPLAQNQIDSIYNWIASGAPNNYCGTYCDTFLVKYNTHLVGILDSKCVRCHNSDAPSGGVTLESYDELVSTTIEGSMPAVLRGADGYGIMPPGPISPLKECDIRKFEIWNENGKPL